MKKTLMIIAVGLASLFLLQCGQKNWIAKVDGEMIPMEEFNKRYDMYMQMRMQQPQLKPLTMDEERLVKRELLRNMIGEHLIYKELKKEKYLQSKEVQDLFKQFVIQRYLEEKFASDINVSSLEVEKFYNQNRQVFANMDPEMAQQRIEYQLKLQKFQERTAEIIDKLYSKARIIQNDAAISPVGTGITVPPPEFKSGK
jgi:hypothetical protein